MRKYDFRVSKRFVSIQFHCSEFTVASHGRWRAIGTSSAAAGPCHWGKCLGAIIVCALPHGMAHAGRSAGRPFS
jgi:hypothetical protein